MPNLIRKIKKNKKFLFSLPLAFISLEIYFGIIFGYFLGKFFAGKYDGYQRIKSIFINIGNYKIHLHHWILSLMIGIFGGLYNLFPIFPQFWFGFLGGLIIQEIYLDENWRKILIKKN
jgi:hypothetical protein